MSTRAQATCVVLFLATLLAPALAFRQAGGNPPALPPQAAPQAPARATEAGLFYSAVSRQFQVPPQQVRQLVDAGLPPGQVVVGYYIAEHSLRQPAQILADREAGMTWRDIAMASGLEPESFYLPTASSRAPFVNVYALYHQQPREGGALQSPPLGDADVESLVNLRFLASVSGRGVPDIMRLRAQGHDDVSIHHFLLAGQQTARWETAAAAEARS